MKFHIKSAIIILSGLSFFMFFNACKKDKKDAMPLIKLDLGCVQLGAPGPYDPTDCLRKQMEELLILAKKAKGNKEMLTIITKESVELNRILETWQGLPLGEKQKRQAMFTALKKTISDKDDFEKGLQYFISISQDKQSISFARSALQENSNSKHCYIFYCICVTAEGCPCCYWDNLIKKVFGTSQT